MIQAVGPLLDRRRRATTTLSWLGWSLAAVLAVVLAALALTTLASLARLPAEARTVILVAATAIGVSIVPGGWWWRAGRRAAPSAVPIRFVLEHATAGVMIAASIAATAWLVARLRTLDDEALASIDDAIEPLRALIEARP